jgi:MFS superfamily sulfate permease-like transporter
VDLENGVLPKKDSLFAHVRSDVPAGAVVFLVALPLCLGIAQASGAPPLAGLIAGVAGGLIVPLISRSALSVSGPAAGLTVLVAAAIEELGFRSFLLSVVLAGGIQATLGILRLGLIAHFLPSTVIKGMLAAIGLLIVLKQIPHAVGYDQDFEGDEAFQEPDGHNTLNAITDAMSSLSWGACLVSVIAIAAALAWPLLQKRVAATRMVPVPLVIVAVGVLGGYATGMIPALTLDREHFVNLPTLSSFSELSLLLQFPDFTQITNADVWRHAVTLALVASLETLLSLEAIDGLDPKRRISPPNRELIAQGLANASAGLIGGIPVTSVIVRSSANAQAGAESRLSAVVHGVLLLVGLLFLAPLLNAIPLAALAIVLILIGLKLSSVSLWQSQWKAGYAQFIPFFVTILAILSTDLLKGTLFGAVVGLAFLVRAQQKNAIVLTQDGQNTLVTFVKDITFLQKARIKEILRALPTGGRVMIDRRAAPFIDPDIDELLRNFSKDASVRQITFSQTFEPGGEDRFRAPQTQGKAAH